MKAVIFALLSFVAASASADSLTGTFSATQVLCANKSPISIKNNPWYSHYVYEMKFSANGEFQERNGYMTLFSGCSSLSKGRYAIKDGVLTINQKVLKADGELIDCSAKNEQAWKIRSLGDGKIELRGSRELFSDRTFKCDEKDIGLVLERTAK